VCKRIVSISPLSKSEKDSYFLPLGGTGRKEPHGITN
jgi:hypothetical protein